jgi:HlyD family secretion protein
VQDQTLVAQDVQKVQSDQGKLLSDQEKASSDQVSGPREVAAAQAQVTAGQDALTQQTTNRATTIAGQQAGVAGDQAGVNNAQQNLAETVLTAPAEGTVASVNGAVGESVTANGGVTTPQAPGSVAPQPNPAGLASAPGSGIAPVTGGAAAASSFVVLSDVHSLQVVAMIGEQDAARMQPTQAAMVSVDALPGVRLPAAVLAVGPNGTVLQNVTNYLATLVLQDSDHRLKAGMTASAAVVVNELDDVLQIPNAAIQRSGGGSYVTVVQSDGTERRTAIQTGQVGDTTTEITSGLRAGERVLLPQPPPPQGNLQ